MKSIKQLREAADMSQEYLARQLAVSRATVANWEAGINEPTAKNIKKLAKVFGLTTDELLGMEE